MNTPPPIAWFISPHGFGHAARASAVMGALLRLDRTLCFSIFTTAPQWIFNASLPGRFSYHPMKTDVGMVQVDPLTEDLSSTMAVLDRFLPFNEQQIVKAAERLKHAHCKMVICDIAPMGIAVARAAGIKSVLIENFTWDWIYAPYLDRAPSIKGHIAYLKSWFKAADIHIQTEPLCKPNKCHLLTGPASRQITCPKEETRKQLGLKPKETMILISMGGVPATYNWLDHLKKYPSYVFVIPGSDDTFKREDNLILMPARSRFYHPNLVHAADAVVGKVGYSTLAEIHQAGTPFGYISRPDFPEAQILSKYVREQMTGIEIMADAFATGRWIETLPELLSLEKPDKTPPNGADQMAAFLMDQI